MKPLQDLLNICVALPLKYAQGGRFFFRFVRHFCGTRRALGPLPKNFSDDQFADSDGMEHVASVVFKIPKHYN